MNNHPSLKHFFDGLDYADTIQLTNIATHYARDIIRLANVEMVELERNAEQMDTPYIRKIVVAGLMSEKDAQAFLAEVATLAFRNQLDLGNDADRGHADAIRPPGKSSFVERTKPKSGFRLSGQMREALSTPTPDISTQLSLVQPSEQETVAAIKQDVIAAVHAKAEEDIAAGNNSVRLPKLSAFSDRLFHQTGLSHDTATRLTAAFAQDALKAFLRAKAHGTESSSESLYM